MEFTLTSSTVLNSNVIQYELISESYGISIDGIESIVEKIGKSVPNITNGHIIAVLTSELEKNAVSTVPVFQQQIDLIAQTYYTGSVWELLESLAFCMKMVEISNMKRIKNQTPLGESPLMGQVVNAVRVACKLNSLGYPEATQMAFRRFAELGVTKEQALKSTLEDDCI